MIGCGESPCRFAMGRTPFLMRLPIETLPPWRWLVALLPVSAAFFFAPLAFGGTTFMTRTAIDSLLVLSFLLWGWILSARQHRPRIPRVLASTLALLVILGAFQYGNPKSIVDSYTFDAEPCAGHIPWLPGSIDAETSGWVLIHLLALLLGGLLLVDGLSRAPIRRFLFRVVAIAGLVVALLGIYQKCVGAETMPWGAVLLPGERNFFAAFRYHGNAASFLNLSWPAALAIWLRSRSRSPGSFLTSVDLYVFLVIFASILVNSSKAGLLIGPTGLILAGWLFRRMLFVGTTSRAAIFIMAGFLVVLCVIAILPGLGINLDKWEQLVTKGDTLHGRIDAQRACLLAIRDTGLYGTGAGTFLYAFPPYKDQIEGLRGFWEHAHQDWLQAIIEWGWLGFAGWGVVFGGALTRLWIRIRKAGRRGRTDLTSGTAFLALLLLLIHSLADFPLQIPALQWLAVFYLAVAWSESEEFTSVERPDRHSGGSAKHNGGAKESLPGNPGS